MKILSKFRNFGVSKSLLSVGILGASLLSSPSSSSAQRLTSDYFQDGDGVSDIGIVQIQEDKSLTFKAGKVGFQSATLMGTLGVSGNNLAVGAWVVPTSLQLGVVDKNADNKIIWTIIDPNGQVVSKEFGSGKGVVVSGADVNGNGITDGIFVSTAKKNLIWNVANDVFSATPGAIQQVKFGRRGNKPFFVSFDGTTDSIAYKKNRKRGRSKINFLNLSTNSRSQISLGRFEKRAGVPEPIKLANGADGLLFVNKRRFSVLDVTGAKVAEGTLAVSGTVFIGDYLNSAGEEIAVRSGTKGEIYIINPVSKQTIQTELEEGIVFDEININTYGSNRGATNPSNPKNDDGGSSGSACKGGTIGFGFPAFWKAKSDTDERPVLLLNGGLKQGGGSLNVVDSTGKSICKIGFIRTGIDPATGKGKNKNAEHYWSGRGAGCGKSGSQMKREASGGRVFISIRGNRCIGPFDPTASRLGGF